MKPSILIVGAGLGGCFLADALAGSWRVIVVEPEATSLPLQERITDTGRPAITSPHVGAGLGGSTNVWHNGLIEIDEQTFRERWPFVKAELDPYYRQAFSLLAGVSSAAVSNAAGDLQRKLTANGVPLEFLWHGLYYPRCRLNVWNALKLKGRVELVRGEVRELIPDEQGRIAAVMVSSASGTRQWDADVVVLAAGGLGTPLLLQYLAKSLPLPGLEHAGRHYEDHPCGFVGEVTLDQPIYKLWNYAVAGGHGNLRLPMVVREGGLLVSFQLRPAVQFHPRKRVINALNDLRNRPFDLRNYGRLLFLWDDVLEILSFRFGINLPTRRYSLLMVAEQPPSEGRAVWQDDPGGIIYRRWETPAAYLSVLKSAIAQLLGGMSGVIRDAGVFERWADELYSSSHHSGTARMSESPEEGVCDRNARVHGLRNLYVCDGSLIPASGFANTGLTIAAMALRLAAHLRQGLPHDVAAQERSVTQPASSRVGL